MDSRRRLLLFGQQKWIMDIHNGILNPNFTYTGGQAIVPDENGILRRTPAGYPAVEGGRWAATVAEGALLGPELITVEADRTFSSDTGWWTKSGAGTTISNGIANVAAAETTIWGLYKGSLLVAGSRYRLLYTLVSANNGGTRILLGTGGAATQRTIPGTYSEEVVCAGDGNLRFYVSAIGASWSIDNISVREVIPQWLPPTAGTTSNISTRKGIRTIQTADTFEGMLVEPAMTNKLTCMKSNPTATTNIPLTGDGAAVLSVVTDPATYLSTAGLADICTTNKIYKWDNSAGVGAAIAVLGGTTGNINVHSFSMYIIAAVGAGTVYLRTDAADAVAIPATFQRLKKENVTPDTTARQVRIAIDAGAIVYFILPQLEESAFCTSIIAPAADTAAAQTRAASVVSASTSGVFPSSGQDFAIFMRVVPEAGGQSGKIALATNSLNNSRVFIEFNATTVLFSKVLSGAFYSVSALYTNVAGTPISVIAMQTQHGETIKVKPEGGVWSGWLLNNSAGAKLASIISPTYQIGAYNSNLQFAANYPITSIIAMPPKATLAEYQTWIEDELTLRGLI